MRHSLLWLLLLSVNSCTGRAGPKNVPQPASGLDTSYLVQDIFTGFSTPKTAVATLVPVMVKERISAHLNQFIAGELPPGGDAAAADLKASIQMILMQLPVSGRITAYVLHLKMMGPVNKYLVYFYNDSNRAVSREPFTYRGAEMQEDEIAFGSGGLPEAPNYGVTDINSDGRPEIMLRERRHNGNVYDANVVHYLCYYDVQQVIEFLPLETWATVPFDTSARRIHRSLHYDAASKEYIISAALVYQGRGQAIGNVRLRQTPDGWRIGKRTELIREYGPLLITCSPTRKELAFLNDNNGRDEAGNK